MKKIIFDMNPLGNFSASCIAHKMYYEEKYNKEIFLYTRNQNGFYIKVTNIEDEFELKNRVLTFKDLGDKVSEIPFDDDIRVPLIDDTLESDEILKRIVEMLGKAASWKNSDLKLVEVGF